ncbi:MAG: Rnase Y domain-containing protein, partial [Lactimicrobium massiliense]
MNPISIAILAVIAGIVIGIIIMMIVGKMGLDRAKEQSHDIIEEANSKAENTVSQAVLSGKQQVSEMKLAAEKEMNAAKSKIQADENRLLRREDNLKLREDSLAQRERKLSDKTKSADAKLANLSKMEDELQQKIDEQLSVLEKTAHMSQDDAHKELMDIVAKKSEKEVGEYIREQQDEAEAQASANARNIIATAIHRYAQEETIERTVSTVTLPSEEMKGRIIGREGRNIRAIETLTGVDLIIDDTPEAVILSGFDPVRREIARVALEKLIVDGRIHPARIEEMVEKATKEVNAIIKEEGEQATFEVGIHNLHPELVKILGRLKYRTSYGQN